MTPNKGLISHSERSLECERRHSQESHLNLVSSRSSVRIRVKHSKRSLGRVQIREKASDVRDSDLRLALSERVVDPPGELAGLVGRSHRLGDHGLRRVGLEDR